MPEAHRRRAAPQDRTRTGSSASRRPAPSRYAPQARKNADRTTAQRAYDGPEIPEGVTSAELDRQIRRQLSGLPDRLAERVGRHIVMAGRLLLEDPQAAYDHALAARSRAGRVAVVREACGEAAYFCGRFAEALADLRAGRRMNGSVDYLPMMADCERGLGRPDRALALARDPAAARLNEAGQIEMTIVAAGARRDRGETATALALLEAAPLHSRSRAEWVSRLRYAYADTLVQAQRHDEAVQWFHRTVAVDAESATDAVERLLELTGSEVDDVDDQNA